MDAAQFVEEFFHGGAVPERVQEDYKEAFTLSNKCEPEDHPKAFQDFVTKQAKADRTLRAILMKAEKSENNDNAVASGRHITGAGNIQTVPVKMELENDDDFDAVFKVGVVSATTVPSIVETEEEPSYVAERQRKCVWNEHLSPKSGRLCSNFEQLEMYVDLAAARESPENSGSAKRMYMYLDSDVESYCDSQNDYIDELTRRILSTRLLPNGHFSPTPLYRHPLKLHTPHMKNETVDADMANGTTGTGIKNSTTGTDMTNNTTGTDTTSGTAGDSAHSGWPIVAVGETHQAESVYMGRVVCDCEGRLNEQSSILEGSRRSSYGRRATLQLRAVPGLLLFPGQVVALMGVSESHEQDSKITVQSLFPGIDPPPPVVPYKRLAKSSALFGAQPIHVAVVSGPFCNKTELSFTRLDAFLRSVKESSPHLCVILGPLVDVNNTLVSAGDLKVIATSNAVERWVTFEQLYAMIGRKLKAYLGNSRTQVIIVPHHDDVMHPFPLPQPPFPLDLLWPEASKTAATHEAQSNYSPPHNIELVSNPCELRVNGCHIAVTSADTLAPVAKVAISRNQTENKFALFCRQILLQQNFFPVEACEVPVEPKRRSALLFSPGLLPNLFLFSSPDIPPFAKEVEKRLFVNTGSIASATSPSVELWIHPWAAPPDASQTTMIEDCIPDRVRVDLLRS